MFASVFLLPVLIASASAWSLRAPTTPMSRIMNDLNIAKKTAVLAFGLSSLLLTGLPVHADEFITTESGLKYTDIVKGEGAVPVAGDTVRVHYTGWLDDFESEKKFDSSYDRRSPLVFKVGTRQVISGWDEALLTDMKVGTKRNVIIPSDLAYGKRGAGGVIPPDATLYFTMELVGIGAR